jgi:uncharacterized membrane protein
LGGGDGRCGRVVALDLRDPARRRASWIHLLSIWTLISLTLAVWFIRRGEVRAHKAFMVGTFLGLARAGLGAMAPGRALSRWLLGGGSGLF